MVHTLLLGRHSSASDMTKHLSNKIIDKTYPSNINKKFK